MCLIANRREGPRKLPRIDQKKLTVFLFAAFVRGNSRRFAIGSDDSPRREAQRRRIERDLIVRDAIRRS